MGIYVCIWLIHFVVQQKQSIVKQLYSNKDVLKKKRLAKKIMPTYNISKNGIMSLWNLMFILRFVLLHFSQYYQDKVLYINVLKWQELYNHLFGIYKV